MQGRLVEIFHCPPGIDPKLPIPETFEVRVAELEAGLTLTPPTVSVGERYRIVVVAWAPDRCNSGSRQIEGRADSADIEHTIERLTMTELACER